MSGCILKSECRIVNQSLNVSEVWFERVPRNVSEQYEGNEVYLVRQYSDVPLTYQVVQGARVSMVKESDEYGTWLQYGTLDPKLNGTVYITLVNNDSIGGLFQIDLRLFKDLSNISRSREAYLEPNESKVFSFDFDLAYGGGWSYSFDVVAPVRKVEVKRPGFREINETRVRTVYDNIKHEEVKTVIKQIQVC
ncbi:MAG: hypothetical protein ABH834_03550 [Candidatus Altiarchaeota archaeon]